MSIKCLKYSQGNCIADSKEIYKIPNAQNWKKYENRK